MSSDEAIIAINDQRFMIIDLMGISLSQMSRMPVLSLITWFHVPVQPSLSHPSHRLPYRRIGRSPAHRAKCDGERRCVDGWIVASKKRPWDSPLLALATPFGRLSSSLRATRSPAPRYTRRFPLRGRIWREKRRAGEHGNRPTEDRWKRLNQDMKKIKINK